jgi:Asp-tRNA(Asn)/Glu-tRNA(Gln) amidotransferase B subunit
MPARSTITKIPVKLRDELDRRLVAGGFSDYEALAAWLNEALEAHGLELSVSRSAVHRYGQSFEQSLASLKQSTEMARFLATELGDDEGVITDAAIRLYQDQLFRVLQEIKLDPENIDPHKIGKVLADISRASVSQKKHMEAVRARAREAADKVAETVKQQGLSSDVVNAIKRDILGVAA